MKIRILSIVLNWNSTAETEKCLRSLEATDAAGFIHDVLVVDNGSTEKSTDRYIKKWLARSIKVIKNRKNLGFSGGANTGIKYAKQGNYDYVALVNSDAVVDKKWLNNLYRSSLKHDSAITTGLILTTGSKLIDSTGVSYSIWGLPFPRDRLESRDTKRDSGYVFGASGGATLYSLKMLEDVGLFDEAFFAYYEDVDISFRARLKGYSVFYEKSAVAYHKIGYSSKKVKGLTTKQAFCNLPLLAIKNVPTRLLLRLAPRFALAYAMMLSKAFVHGYGGYAFLGYLKSVVILPKALWNRYNIQKTRRIKTKSLTSLISQSLPPRQTGLQKLVSKVPFLQ